MIYIYRFILNIIIILSPFIILIRLLKKKEHPRRFWEKFCFFSEKKKKGKTIWFHGASVGELKSITPLLEMMEKNKKINQILVTSNTLSSSKIMENFKSKKIIHQFFPIDTNYHTKRFINYWNPEFAIFVDSEIWPNMIFNLKKKKIPIGLINGRITKKTFDRWMLFPFSSKKIFSNFDLCLSSSNESKTYLKKLGIKNVKLFGNLKFSQSNNEKKDFDNKIRKFIKSKKVWCASSTHNPEEKFCALVHKQLKKKYKNLVTIIIPRHIDRVKNIENELKKLSLKIHVHEPQRKIKNDTDIYIVNTYGNTKFFFNNCHNIFLGGSLIKHGGQNPLEAARYGCNIFHGPNVSNFKEIYNFLKKNKIAHKINNQKDITSLLNKFLSKSSNSTKIQKKLNYIGHKILIKTYNEISLLL